MIFLNALFAVEMHLKCFIESKFPTFNILDSSLADKNMK